MPTARTAPVPKNESNEKLQERYKPLGLPAVVAATQCKPEKKAKEARQKRDIPAVLQSLYD